MRRTSTALRGVAMSAVSMIVFSGLTALGAGEPLVLSAERATRGEDVVVTGAILDGLVKPVVSLVPVHPLSGQAEGKFIRQGRVRWDENGLSFRVRRVRPGHHSVFVQPDGRHSAPVILQDALRVVGPRVVDLPDGEFAAGERVAMTVAHLGRRSFRVYVGGRRARGVRRKGDQIRFRVPSRLVPGLHSVEVSCRFDPGGSEALLRVGGDAVGTAPIPPTSTISGRWLPRDHHTESLYAYDDFGGEMVVQAQILSNSDPDFRGELRLSLETRALLLFDGPTSIGVRSLRLSTSERDSSSAGRRETKLYLQQAAGRVSARVLAFDRRAGNLHVALSGVLERIPIHYPGDLGSEPGSDNRNFALRDTQIVIRAPDAFDMRIGIVRSVFTTATVDEASTDAEVEVSEHGAEAPQGPGSFRYTSRFFGLDLSDAELRPLLYDADFHSWVDRGQAVWLEVQLARPSTQDPDQPDLGATSEWLPIVVRDRTTTFPNGAFDQWDGIPPDPDGGETRLPILPAATAGRGYAFARVRVRLVDENASPYSWGPYVSTTLLTFTAPEFEGR